MGKLIYTMLTSLDGYVSDPDGNFEWAAPDEEVHAFINQQSRSIGTELYGRRMYETMAVWETMELDDEPPVMADYAQIWRASDKVVYSSTLAEVSSARTRLERTFDPEAVRQLKAESAHDISVSGPHLAAAAIRAGLVDEYRLFVSPVVVGGGNACLPDDIRIDLELVDHRRFGNGFVYLAYAVT
jgi:dihydrofolate reductase